MRKTSLITSIFNHAMQIYQIHFTAEFEYFKTLQDKLISVDELFKRKSKDNKIDIQSYTSNIN